MNLKIPIKLEAEAKPPVKGSAGAAGYDLFAYEAAIIYPTDRAAIRTGVFLAIPDGLYGRIAPRSGLALKKGIDVLGGVIDSDYRGELAVILQNHGTERVCIYPGDKIAQIIFERCHDADFVGLDELPPTERGQGGFGSTGK